MKRRKSCSAPPQINIVRSNSVSNLIRTFSSSDIDIIPVTSTKSKMASNIKTAFNKASSAMEDVIGGKKKKEQKQEEKQADSSDSSWPPKDGEDESVFEEAASQMSGGLEDMDHQEGDKKRKKNQGSNESSPRDSPIKMPRSGEATAEHGLKPEVYDAILQRLMQLEIQVATMAPVVGKVSEVREECTDTCAKMFQRVEEVTEKVEAVEAEAKAAAQRMDTKMEHLVKEVDKKLSTNLEEMFERLKKAEESSSDLRLTMASMEKAYREMQSGDNLPAQSRSGAGIYLAGLDKLRVIYHADRSVDPIEVVKRLLFDAKCYYFYDRIYLADKQANRIDTRAAMIHFSSVQTKKDAEVKIKRQLAQLTARGVMIRDLFPQERMLEVRGLNKTGFEMKAAGKCERFRIINRQDKPILQVLYKNTFRYEDVQPEGYEESMDTGAPEKRPLLQILAEKNAEKEKEKEKEKEGGGEKDKENEAPKTLLATQAKYFQPARVPLGYRQPEDNNGGSSNAGGQSTKTDGARGGMQRGAQRGATTGGRGFSMSGGDYVGGGFGGQRGSRSRYQQQSRFDRGGHNSDEDEYRWSGGYM